MHEDETVIRTNSESESKSTETTHIQQHRRSRRKLCTRFERRRLPNVQHSRHGDRIPNRNVDTSRKRITNIKRVQFDWNSKGLLKVEDAVHEASKQGDDAFIRVGLILKSKSDFIDLFGSPQWIRKVAEVLNHSADRVVFSFREPEMLRGNVGKIHSARKSK